MLREDIERFRLRSREERLAAENEPDPGKRAIHEQLADQYDQVIALYEELRQLDPGEAERGGERTHSSYQRVAGNRRN
jgi:hypothetical protein